MNKIIKKQVLATFALVTIMAGVLIGTNCIYAAQDGKETTTIRLINQTYFNVKNIKVTWNDGKEQTVNTLGSHDSHQMPEAYTKWMLPEQPSPERNSPDILRDWSAKIQEYL